MTQLVISGLRGSITDEQVHDLRRTLLARLGAVTDLFFDSDAFEVVAGRDAEHAGRVNCMVEGFPPLELSVRTLVHGLIEDTVALWMDRIGCDYEVIYVRLDMTSQARSNIRHQSPDKYARITLQLGSRIARYAREEERAQGPRPADAALWHELVVGLAGWMSEVLAMHDALVHRPA